MKSPLPAVRALVLASLVLAACSTRTETVDLAQFSAFKDMGEAPAAIKSAAAAVVRIGTAHAYGTGSFISADGMLLTNNHVLGIEVCAREGCHATLARNHQRGFAAEETIGVFAKPLHVSVGLDMAVVQVFNIDSNGQPTVPLSSPEFLTLESLDAASLLGTKVYVVGHPEGRLKKWSAGEVATVSGEWFQSTAFSLPGNSGSPMLNEAGRVVGLLHRGPSGQDLITRKEVTVYSIGTASGPLSAAMNEELPPTTRSITAETTAADVVANETIFLNAQVSSATIAKTETPVLGVLAEACDKGLARTDFVSPDELDDFVHPCVAALSWVECEVEEKGAFSVCPADDQLQAWRDRYLAVFERYRALNGSLWLNGLTFGMGALESSSASGDAAAAQRLRDVLANVQPALDFSIAPYLATFGVSDYGGVDLTEYVTHYDRVPHYELSIYPIAYAALRLNRGKKLDVKGTVDILQRLINDEKVSLGPKLYLEEVLHNSKVID